MEYFPFEIFSTENIKRKKTKTAVVAEPSHTPMTPGYVIGIKNETITQLKCSGMTLDIDGFDMIEIKIYRENAANENQGSQLLLQEISEYRLNYILGSFCLCLVQESSRVLFENVTTFYVIGSYGLF